MIVYRTWVALGAVMGALAVAAAAYAAHAPIDEGRMRAVASGVQMQGWHAIALIACGLLGAAGGWPVHVAGTLFLVGTALFAGAVWSPVFGGPPLGMTAPVGGTMLILGWLALAVAGLGAFRAPGSP